MKFKAFLGKYNWLIALVVAFIFGYAFGKDMALKDNAKDNASLETHSE